MDFAQSLRKIKRVQAFLRYGARARGPGEVKPFTILGIFPDFSL